MVAATWLVPAFVVCPTGPSQKGMLAMEALDETSSSRDGSQHGKNCVIKRYLGERPYLWHLADPGGVGIGPWVPSSTVAPVKAATRADQLASHDMEATGPVLHADNARLHSCNPAAQLTAEIAARTAAAPAMSAALIQPLP